MSRSTTLKGIEVFVVIAESGADGVCFSMQLTRSQWRTIYKALRDSDSPPVTRQEIESLRELILSLQKYR